MPRHPALLFAAACAALLLSRAAAPAQGTPEKAAGVYQFTLKDIDGRPVALSKYRGKVVLLVNVASECGYTGQYKALQALHAKYAGDGLAVLGVPSNDFGGQEPGTEAEIKAFCAKNYGVKFDLFSKVKIGGDDASPLYKYLTARETNPEHAGPVRWNFEKFLIGRDGRVVARFASDVDPEGQPFVDAIRKELERKVR